MNNNIDEENVKEIQMDEFLTSEYMLDDMFETEMKLNEFKYDNFINYEKKEYIKTNDNKINLSTIKDSLFYLLDGVMINFFLKYTNENIERKNYALKKNVLKVTKKDIFLYLAIYVYTMIMPIKNIKYFWKKTILRQNIIADLMSHERFTELNQVFTVVGKKDYFQSKVIYKPKAAKYLFKLSREAFEIKREIAIDESIMPFRGNLKNPAYSPMKNHSRGMKMYTLNDSESGFCFEQRICSGKSTIDEIFNDLLKDFVGKWHHLYVDNFYTSAKLAENLLLKGIYLCGTLRYNRGEPKDFKSKCSGLKKQEFLIVQKNEINILGYHDKKVVKLLTTVHNIEEIIPSDNKKPILINNYNQYMGGTDLMDQGISNYDPDRRNKR